jgi:hypothetical protein
MNVQIKLQLLKKTLKNLDLTIILSLLRRTRIQAFLETKDANTTSLVKGVTEQNKQQQALWLTVTANAGTRR